MAGLGLVGLARDAASGLQTKAKKRNERINDPFDILAAPNVKRGGSTQARPADASTTPSSASPTPAVQKTLNQIRKPRKRGREGSR